MVRPPWKPVWKFLVKPNICLAYCPVIPVLHIYPRKMKTRVHKDLDMNVSGQFLYNNLKLETVQVFISRRMGKPIVINPQTKYYSTVRRNEVSVYIIRVNLRIVLLSERSQTQKSIYCLIQFIWNCRKGETNLQIESRSVMTWAGIWGRGLIVKGHKGSLAGGDGSILFLIIMVITWLM